MGLELAFKNESCSEQEQNRKETALALALIRSWRDWMRRRACRVNPQSRPAKPPIVRAVIDLARTNLFR